MSSLVSVRHNSFFGFLGFAVPVLVLFLAYPILIKHLGMARLGVYFLATSMSGTLAFLDAGFSSATLKFIAEDLAQGRKTSAAEVLAASLCFYGAVGIAGGLFLGLASPWLVAVFKIDKGIQREALWTFRLASIQFSILFMLTVFISLFKGMHRFHLSTLSLSILSVLTYGGAVLAVLLAHAGLVGVTAIGLAANTLVLAGSAVVGFRLCSSEGIRPFDVRPSLRVYRRMLGFGSAMLINGFASLFQNQIQRYVIGMTLGPAAVAIFQTACVIPGKIHAAVNAATEVLFPVSSAVKDPVYLRRIYLRMLGGTAACAALAFVLLLSLGPWFLSLWLRENCSPQMKSLLIVFAIAFFFLALTPPPFYLLNGMGKPWINTILFTFTASLNLLLIGVSFLFGVSLIGIAWAFAVAVICGSTACHVVVERCVWKKLLPDDAVPATIAVPAYE
jgi:O-antigen/teichoic acid export membrane protein